MSTRPTRALLGVLTLAAALAATASPAHADGKAPQACPSGPNIIISNAHTIEGTECADWVFPGAATRVVNTHDGDDVVKVTGAAPPPDDRSFRVDLGEGDDELTVQRAVRITGYGLGGDDVLRADWMVVGGGLHGFDGDDRLWTASPHVELRGWEGDDRLDVTATTTQPPLPLAQGQRIWAGPGDDVVSTIGASGPGVRTIIETLGDDLYLLRHAQGEQGVDRIIMDTDWGSGGADVAKVDPNDALEPKLWGFVEEYLVGWAQGG